MPTDDLLTQLGEAEVDGARLTEREGRESLEARPCVGLPSPP
jgi:hypothetical protein